MKFSAIWRLLLVYGCPAIALIGISFYGFAHGRILLGTLTAIIAIASMAACGYFIAEVSEKEKILAEKNQLAEKNRQKYPRKLGEWPRPIRSANEEEALKEILRDLKEPLRLKIPGSETPTEEKQKG